MSPAEAEAALRSDIGGFYANPLAFVRYTFPWGSKELEGEPGPDKWQTALLERLGAAVKANDHNETAASIRLAVSSGHGVGKTALVAWIILWFMSTRPNCAGVVTANTQDQLANKTWRELAKWHRLAINAHWFDWTATKFAAASAPETWFIAATPWTKQRSEAFAGLHETDVLVIYDEASAIDDVIWQVSEGAMTTPGAIWLAFGNPTRNDGAFSRCFGSQRHRWDTVRVDSRDARKANRAQIDQWIADYGEDSDFVRVRVRGEFPRASTNQLIGLDLVEPRKFEGRSAGPLVIGVDVARFGDDESVIYVRDGRETVEVKRYRGVDLMQLAGFVGESINKHRPDATFIDGVGVGGGVVDRLRQLGYRCVDVNAGGKAGDERKYHNKRAEMWSKMRDWLIAGGCLPDDQRLRDDLTGPQYGFDNQNRIQLERKEDMKERGLASPDAADALALTFAQPVVSPDIVAARDRVQQYADTGDGSAGFSM